MANAIRHARALPSGHLQVAWDVTDHDITISVTDGGSEQTPRIRDATAQDTSGRGLAIVAALANEWGTRVRGRHHHGVGPHQRPQRRRRSPLSPAARRLSGTDGQGR